MNGSWQLELWNCAKHTDCLWSTTANQSLHTDWCMDEWVSKWMNEWVSEWVSDWPIQRRPVKSTTMWRGQWQMNDPIVLTQVEPSLHSSGNVRHSSTSNTQAPSSDQLHAERHHTANVCMSRSSAADEWLMISPHIWYSVWTMSTCNGIRELFRRSTIQRG